MEEVPLYKIDQNYEEPGHSFFVCMYPPEGLEDTPIHMHEYMQINYVYNGNARHVINNREFDVMKGDIFVIPPYISHTLYCAHGQKSEVVQFEFMSSFLNQNFREFDNARSFLDFAYIEPFLVSENLVKPRLNVVGKIQIEVENILKEVLKEDEQKQEGYDLLIRSQLLKLLILVGREFTKKLENSMIQPMYDRHRESILQAVDFVDTNFMQELTIDIIAKKFLLSTSYFSYLFKSITSKTFTEYLIGVRISKALELLRTTNKRVVDICLSVGFNNVNHFNRTFKQTIGITPLGYRKKDNEQ